MAQSRAPWLFAPGAISDSPEGRFDAIVLHLVVVMRRLGRAGAPGARLARHTAEAFITDVDDNLRELGVGDLNVPRRIKKAGAALYDRHRMLVTLINDRDRSGLAQALVADGLSQTAVFRQPLADYLLAAADTLDGLPDEAALAGRIRFPPPPA